MATRPHLDRTQRLEQIARDVSRLADRSVIIRNSDHYDDCEEEASRIARHLTAVFRGR
jgi:predicted transcriptional regulator